MKQSVQYLSSELLNTAGVTHGWFMRYGGTSSGAYESLNGKKGMDDADEHVIENRQRALTTLRPVTAMHSGQLNRQVAHIIHEFKDNILMVREAGEFRGFDASIATLNDVVLSQTTADCGTVIIASVGGDALTILHGSWHTLSAKIICKTVAKLKTITQLELVAGVGPMICKNCYDFGSEAKNLFEPKYITPKGEKYLVDLKQMVIDQLHESGVTKVDDLDICTFEDERFFSVRRDGSNSGRFLTLATL